MLLNDMKSEIDFMNHALTIDKQGNYSFTLPFPHKLARAPATILSVCESSVLDAIVASNRAPPLLIISP